jgi:hypothetical protein
MNFMEKTGVPRVNASAASGAGMHSKTTTFYRRIAGRFQNIFLVAGMVRVRRKVYGRAS